MGSNSFFHLLDRVKMKTPTGRSTSLDSSLKAIFSFWSSNHLVQHHRLTSVNYFQNCRTSRIDRDKVACREGGFKSNPAYVTLHHENLPFYLLFDVYYSLLPKLGIPRHPLRDFHLRYHRSAPYRQASKFALLLSIRKLCTRCALHRPYGRLYCRIPYQVDVELHSR
jgi:hypothetical protein